jgi:hypothetical protein
MRKRNGVILAVIGYVVFFSCIEGWGVDWEKHGESDKTFFYYDTENITRPSKDVVRVWGKLIFKVKGKTEMAEELGKKYETLSHSINLIELHCAEKKIRRLSFAYYSTDGKVLESGQSPEENWRFIPPDSVGESLYNILCK